MGESVLGDGGQVVVVRDPGVELAGPVVQVRGQRLHGPQRHGVQRQQRVVQRVQRARGRGQQQRAQPGRRLAAAARVPGLLRPRAEVLAAAPANRRVRGRTCVIAVLPY